MTNDIKTVEWIQAWLDTKIWVNKGLERTMWVQWKVLDYYQQTLATSYSSHISWAFRDAIQSIEKQVSIFNKQVDWLRATFSGRETDEFEKKFFGDSLASKKRIFKVTIPPTNFTNLLKSISQSSKTDISELLIAIKKAETDAIAYADSVID